MRQSVIQHEIITNIIWRRSILCLWLSRVHVSEERINGRSIWLAFCDMNVSTARLRQIHACIEREEDADERFYRSTRTCCCLSAQFRCETSMDEPSARVHMLCPCLTSFFAFYVSTMTRVQYTTGNRPKRNTLNWFWWLPLLARRRYFERDGVLGP